jgi:hypothetical protein
VKEKIMTPYFKALTWIRQHPGCGACMGLCKLLLSLWNDECGYSYRECTRQLDSELSELALQIIQYWHQVGEDRELVEIGHEIIRTYPRLWDITEAQNEARYTLECKWRDEAEAEANRLDAMG